MHSAILPEQPRSRILREFYTALGQILAFLYQFLARVDQVIRDSFFCRPISGEFVGPTLVPVAPLPPRSRRISGECIPPKKKADARLAVRLPRGQRT